MFTVQEKRALEINFSSGSNISQGHLNKQLPTKPPRSAAADVSVHFQGPKHKVAKVRSRESGVLAESCWSADGEEETASTGERSQVTDGRTH